MNFSCVSFANPVKVIYLIPENFTSGVIIVFNQPDGITPETDKDGAIIYRVPNDGLIKIKDPLGKNAYQFSYFYTDGQGNRTPIEYLYPKHYVRNPGDKTTRNFDEITEYEAGNKVFASFHETTNFNVSGEKVYIQDFVVETPKITEKNLLIVNHRVFDIQREFIKGAQTITGKPQNGN